MDDRRKANPDQCCQRIAWRDLDPGPIRDLIRLAMEEDLRGSGLRAKPKMPGDHSSALLVENQRIDAQLTAREPMAVCGLEIAKETIAAYDPQLTLEALVNDGDQIAAGTALAKLSGPLRPALSAERPMLNFLQKLSGVATETHRYASALEDSATRLLDTRKTTPGFRYLEKYAVACGGGWNHRMGLFDRIMLKDNHLAGLGDNLLEAAKAAVALSRRSNPNLLVEMEVDCLEQIPIALEAEVDIILLDNFSGKGLEQAVAIINQRAVTEASGGIALEALPGLKDIGLDFVSTGALTHHSRWVDIGLDWE